MPPWHPNLLRTKPTSSGFSVHLGKSDFIFGISESYPGELIYIEGSLKSGTQCVGIRMVCIHCCITQSFLHVRCEWLALLDLHWLAVVERFVSHCAKMLFILIDGHAAAQLGAVPIGTPLAQPIHGLVTDPVTAQVNQKAYKRQRIRSLACTVRTC